MKILQACRLYEAVRAGMTSTGIPYVRAFVKKLGDEGNEKEAKAVAKEFQELLNRTQKLFRHGSVLSAEL